MIQTHDNYVYCWLYAQFQSRITTQRYSWITFSKPLFRGHRLERARQFRLSSSLTGDAMSKKLKLKLKNKRMSFCDVLITIYSHQSIFFVTFVQNKNWGLVCVPLPKKMKTKKINFNKNSKEHVSPLDSALTDLQGKH